MWKLLLATCFAVGTAVLIESHYPVATKYNFVYAVNDPFTHDIKNQWERRVGDKVQGSYRVVESDGTVRTVDYYADGKNGFRATVTREGQAYQFVQPHENVVRVGLPQQFYVPQQRDYYGAVFVQEKSYGRGLGYY